MIGVFTDTGFTISRNWRALGQAVSPQPASPQGVKPPESTENEKHDSSSGAGEEWGTGES